MKAAKQSLFGRNSQFILLWWMEIAHLPVVSLLVMTLLYPERQPVEIFYSFKAGSFVVRGFIKTMLTQVKVKH